MLAHGGHEIPDVGVVTTPADAKRPAVELGFHPRQDRACIGNCRVGDVQGVATSIIHKPLVDLIDLKVLLDGMLPTAFDVVVDVGCRRKTAAVAVQGHVGIGDVVAEHEQELGDVIVRGRHRRALVFPVLDLEVVDHGLREGFAAIGQVVVFIDRVRLLVQTGRGAVVEHEVGARQILEPIVTGCIRREFEHVAVGIVLDHRVRVPGTPDDAVLVVFKPADQAVGDGSVVIG